MSDSLLLADWLTDRDVDRLKDRWVQLTKQMEKSLKRETNGQEDKPVNTEKNRQTYQHTEGFRGEQIVKSIDQQSGLEIDRETN